MSITTIAYTIAFFVNLVLVAVAAQGGNGNGRFVNVEGSYTPIIDYSQLELTPVTTPSDGETCFATIPILLEFDGDIVGTAPTTASVHIGGSCASVQVGESNADLFYMKGIFRGFLPGEELAVGELAFSGFTNGDGSINGKIIMEGPFFGTLDVEGVINVGGTYSGALEAI